MILVDVTVLQFNKSYEFKLNEDVSTSLVINEICAVICEKEQFRMPRDITGMMLVNSDTGAQLSDSLSLYENNIGNGSRLLLV